MWMTCPLGGRKVTRWAIGLRILAGPADAPGGESFDPTVCSVGWVASRVRGNGFFDGRYHLVTDGFDWPALKSYIEGRVDVCEGASWQEVAERLGRLGYWEFEDYRP